MRTQPLTRTSRSAISVPPTIVRPTLHDREDHRPEDCVPEDLVVQDGGEVLEPDPLALVPNQLEQRVVLEREPDEAVDRIAKDRRERRNDGEDQ